jgi:signal transduction histidine kinase
MAATVAAAPPRARSPLRAVLGVWLRGSTYRNLGYLLLALPLGIVYFTVLVTGVSTGVSLAITLIGLPLLALTLAAWRGFAQFERAQARALLDVEIADPPRPPAGLPVLRRLSVWLRDPATWKSLVFLLAKLPLGIVAFVVLSLGAGAIALIVAPAVVTAIPMTVFGWRIDTPGQAAVLVPAGLVWGLLWLHLCNGLSWVLGLFAKVMLGPGAAQLVERVDDLRDARARILAAADAERRRIERDLHDGAQQRLVALSLNLKLAKAKLPADPQAAEALLAEAATEADSAVKELRELARGIHPALLSERGLPAAVDALAARAPIPVTVRGMPDHRLPPEVETALYYVTAEALTNVAKYARASEVTVDVAEQPGEVCLEVHDDGVGGANLDTGSGLRGLRDRVEALDGRLEIRSPASRGTLVAATIPVRGR